MQDKKIEYLVIEYLDNDTPKYRKEEIRDELKNLNFDLSELDEMKKIDSELESINIVSPSEKLDLEFFKMLESEREKSKNNKVSVWEMIYSKFVENKIANKLVYSFCLLIIGWFLGTQFSPINNEQKLDSLNSQVNDMKEVLMISMLNQSSPMERIKAVNFTNDMDNVDLKIVEALIHTLNHDENVNVRVVTIEALSKFTKIPEVRAGLIKSISHQNSPIVQLALVDLMVKIQEKKSREQFEKLLSKKDLRYTVREKIQNSIKLL